MSLYKQIQNEIKACMKSGEKQKLSVLRMVLTEMKYEQAKTDISKDLDDKGCMKVMEGYYKKLSKSSEEYPDGDHKTKILKEMKILFPYLPKKASPEETQNAINEVLSANDGENNFGVLMKQVLSSLGPQADGKLVSQLLKKSI